MRKQRVALACVAALTLSIGGCAAQDQEEDSASSPTTVAVHKSALDEIEEVVVTGKRPRETNPDEGGGGGIIGHSSGGGSSAGGGGGGARPTANRERCQDTRSTCKTTAVAKYDRCLADVVSLASAGAGIDIIIERKNRCASTLDAEATQCDAAAAAAGC